MPHNDDTDRYCPRCHGRRFFFDTSRDSYAPGATSLTRCDVCWVPETPEAPEAPRKSDDELVAEATDRLIAQWGITKAEYYTVRAELAGWRE